MPVWPAEWPDEVRETYASLAARRRWSDRVVAGVVANVEYLRRLDANDQARLYFGGVFENARWLIETVHDGSQCVAVRQIVVERDGTLHRCSWRAREDEAGGLTDQAVADGGGLRRSDP